MLDTVCLVAKNISKKYQEKLALSDVSLQLKKGQCLALLGPNGAGKTTCCEILEGLIEPDSGSVSVAGYTYAHNRVKIQEMIGVTLQETNLYKRYTVKETLTLFASFYPKTLEIHKILKDFDLESEADNQLAHLSGGTRQRVYLACALVHDPMLVFLDEPTTGLDPNARQSLWEMIRRLKKQGKSILLTTHYMEEAQVLADSLAIMDKGEIIAQGSVTEILKTYCAQDILQFSVEEHGTSLVDAFNKLKTDCSWLDASQLLDNKIQVPTHDISGSVKRLVLEAEKKHIQIRELSIRPSTLEDVFIRLTGRSIGEI